LQMIRKNAQSWTPSTAIPRITLVTFCKPWKDLSASRRAVEQNHSSIVAHLGNGGTLNLAEQVCHLIKRHKSHVLRRQQADYALTITSSNYKSKYSSSIEARDDKNANKTLSLFAYKQFTECLQHARRVQFCEDSDGIYTVWPVNKPEEETVLPARQDACARKGSKCSSSVTTS
jgi:hypothetical protein